MGNDMKIRKWAAIALAVLILTASGCGKTAKDAEAGLQDEACVEEELGGEKAEDGESGSSGYTEESEDMEAAVQTGVREEEMPGAYAFLLCPEREMEDYIPLHLPLADYAVGQGESLWEIGENMLGDGRRWEEIALLNELSAPYLIHPGQSLSMPDKVFYLQKPAFQRGEGDYLSDEGVFRFQTPEAWALATCSLDTHLSTFIGDDSSVRVLWGIEDNEMGEDAWAKNWDSVCRNMEQTAKTVFKDNLKDIFFEKYELEDGKEVYNVCCSFWDEEGSGWTVSAAYRFGKKNLVEFIGIGPSWHELDMGKLALYTAATYEEYGEERHMGYGEEEGKEAVYRGMSVWAYPQLHNPFVLAYECVNDRNWFLKKELEEAEEDYIIQWKEPVLPAVIREALDIEGDIMYSDVLKIESLEVIEAVRFDYCNINEERFDTDWKDIPDGNALVQDIAVCKNLYSLRVQIGDVSDFSPLGELERLEELKIQAGRTVKDVSFLDKMKNLRICVLEKAPQQNFVDSLSDELWERTCEEEGLSSFRKEYDGEPGLAFEYFDF